MLPLAASAAGPALLISLAGCGDVSAYRADASRPERHSGLGMTRPAPPRPVDCARARCVALTFDDGPREHTERLLGYLRRARVRATFFVLGQNVRGNAGALREAVRDGHEIANHSWSHPPMTTLSRGGVRYQVRRTQQEIARTAWVTPKLFRPPYGLTDARVGRIVGMPQILWDVDPLDWRTGNSDRVAGAVVRRARRGSIVLMHDSRRPTVAAVPRILSGLKRRGLQPATVSEVLKGRALRPGRIYRHG